MYKICFSPANLSYVNLILRPAKEPKREEEKSFPPSQFLLKIKIKTNHASIFLITGPGALHESVSQNVIPGPTVLALPRNLL